METVEIIKAISAWGPGLIILLGIYKLADNIGLKLVTASENQAKALTAQATSMEGLTASIRAFVERDTTEHREMLTLLKYIAQEIPALQEVKDEHRDRKKQGYPLCASAPAQD